MSDTAYERIIRIMQQRGADYNSAEVQIGVMTGKDALKIGDLELQKEDLLFNELLIRPQLRIGPRSGKISIAAGPFQTFQEQDSADDETQELVSGFELKAGDIVAVTKIDDDCYAVLGRLVSV